MQVPNARSHNMAKHCCCDNYAQTSEHEQEERTSLTQVLWSAQSLDSARLPGISRPPQGSAQTFRLQELADSGPLKSVLQARHCPPAKAACEGGSTFEHDRTAPRGCRNRNTTGLMTLADSADVLRPLRGCCVARCAEPST